MAAVKLDTETFEHLIELGCDPLLPDADGNIFTASFKLEVNYCRLLLQLRRLKAREACCPRLLPRSRSL